LVITLGKSDEISFLSLQIDSGKFIFQSGTKNVTHISATIVTEAQQILTEEKQLWRMIWRPFLMNFLIKKL
jgi:hypothetical protein